VSGCNVLTVVDDCEELDAASLGISCIQINSMNFENFLLQKTFYYRSESNCKQTRIPTPLSAFSSELLCLCSTGTSALPLVSASNGATAVVLAPNLPLPAKLIFGPGRNGRIC